MPINTNDNINELINICKREARWIDPQTRLLFFKALDKVNNDLIRGEYDMPDDTRKTIDDLVEHLQNRDSEVTEEETPKETPRRITPILEDDDDEEDI